MKYRLSHVILAHPFTIPTEMVQGRAKDGNMSEHEGFILDRIGDALFIGHKKTGARLVKTVPWSAVADASVSPTQPEWSDWPATSEMLYPMPKPAISDEDQPQVGAPQYPGRKVDGRTREARALKGEA